MQLPHCMLGYTPPEQTAPPPPPRVDTPGTVHAGRYGQKREVRILLECNLVATYFL